MLKSRFRGSEMIDDFDAGGEKLNSALEELHIINKFLGGYSATGSGLKFVKKKIPRNSLRILDVGAGGSELKSINLNDITADVISLDRNKNICRYLRKKSLNLKILSADAFHLPFREKVFDVVHASLFLHHFNEEEIITLLKDFIRISRFHVLINDLRRSAAAYYGISILTKIFSKNEMIKNDAPVSVRRGFKYYELQNILNFLPSSDYIIKRKWAFRWLIIIKAG